MSPGMARWRPALRSVTGQLLTLAAVLCAIIVAAAVVLVVTLTQSNDAGAHTRMLSRARADSATTVAALLREQNGVLAFVVTGDPAEREVIATARATFAAGAASLRTELPADNAANALVDPFVAAAQRWEQQVGDPVLAAVASGDVASARALAASGTAATLQVGVQDAARALWARLDADYRTSLAASIDIRTRLTSLVVAVLVLFLVAVVAAALIVRRSVVQPLLRMQAAAKRVADGAWDDTVRVRGPVEVLALASDVDRMRASLLHALASARRAAEALDQQGPAVVALREALAPSPWRQHGFESSGRLDPVEGLLAGDWYDVVALDDHRVGVILGDVAGHGAASGVYALRLKGLLRNALLAGASPSATIAATAAHIAQFPDNRRVASGELFATVFVAVADREVGELTYASAGHLDAVAMRAVTPSGASSPVPVDDADVWLWDSVDLPPTGPMLSALLADRIWSERRHRFSPHDLLVTATDGVIEARDARGDDEYGTGRIVDRLGARLLQGDTLDAAVDAVFDDVAGFERRARDDRTMVVLRQASVRRRFDATRVGSARPVRP